MKLPWRRPRAGAIEKAVEKTAIDITTPRECILQSFADDPGPCPRCNGPLQQSRQTYMIATRHGREITDSFVVGNDMGWFCTQCPTVVIDPQEVSEFLQHGLPHWDIGNQFAVTGIVNLDAVPEEKHHLPLGGDDNPYPLIEFTNLSYGRERHPAATIKSPARDSDLPLEERYEDVLQNIEFGIIQVYRQHPELTDWDALNAVESLIRGYQAESKGRQVGPPALFPLAQQVRESVWGLCEIRLGRNTFHDAGGEPVDMGMEPIALEELIACLKRIRKSINRWTREGGRQGYLSFVDGFFR